MEAENLLSRQQVPATGDCPQTDEFSTEPLILRSLYILSTILCAFSKKHSEDEVYEI